MSRLKLRNISAGRALVCDRATGWPIAEINRDRQRFVFPGYGAVVATLWRVTVGEYELSVDRTRAGALRAAVPALIRRRLLRTENHT